jgi:hypothetical protein
MGNVTGEAAIDALSATEDARNQLNAIPRSDRAPGVQAVPPATRARSPYCVTRQSGSDPSPAASPQAGQGAKRSTHYFLGRTLVPANGKKQSQRVYGPIVFVVVLTIIYLLLVTWRSG